MWVAFGVSPIPAPIPFEALRLFVDAHVEAEALQVHRRNRPTQAGTDNGDSSSSRHQRLNFFGVAMVPPHRCPIHPGAGRRLTISHQHGDFAWVQRSRSRPRNGHKLSAYTAGPSDAQRGLVVIQEIFGVNSHIRNVCDRFAAAGYSVIAPALFDRAGPGIELGYGPDDITKGREARGKTNEAGIMADVKAARKALKAPHAGIVG